MKKNMSLTQDWNEEVKKSNERSMNFFKQRPYTKEMHQALENYNNCIKNEMEAIIKLEELERDD